MISSERSWKFDFKLVLTNSEADEFTTVLTVIGDSPPVLDSMSDIRRWLLHSTGVFSVKTLYTKLVESSGIDNFPYQFVWKTTIPPKINLFVWSLTHGKLNTKNVLLHKGLEVQNCCVLWGNVLETQDHLFLHCKIAHRVWSMLLPSNCCAWVTPRTM
ncbi:uncharacterized protein LOC113288513 [Papaver somniferum]|uniref:uncharacterized protein LOC113288513 n=1 Tax=Papaver somniferum TaxID=3469 RepID=UPI000E7005CB|nr:uncharacterized protein LOC113288513 [Papaver somniferum]